MSNHPNDFSGAIFAIMAVAVVALIGAELLLYWLRS